MLPPSSRRHVAAAVLTTLVGLLLHAAPAAAAASPPEQDVLAMVNDLRAAHGRPPLTLDSGMSDDARGWSAHMAATGLAHDPNHRRSCDRFPGWDACWENVGYGSSARSVEQQFEGSSTHRANLLCDCTHIGIGVASGGGQVWLTQRFVKADPATSYAAAPSADQVEAARNFVTSAYVDLLGRNPSQSELDHWTPRVGSPDARTRFSAALGYSDEWIGALVDGYYEVALERAADPEGRRHWIDVIRSRQLTPSRVAATFYASDEYFARRGNDLRSWISDLYQELLGRAADRSGLDHWTRVARAYGRGKVSSDFFDSTESLHRRIGALYEDLLGRSVDAAGRDHWAGVLRRSGNDVDLAVSLVASTEYHRRAQS